MTGTTCSHPSLYAHLLDGGRGLGTDGDRIRGRGADALGRGPTVSRLV